MNASIDLLKSFLRNLRLMVTAVVAVVTVLGNGSMAYADDTAVKFMRRAAASLINAQKQGTAESFQRVVKQYGHVPAIGLAALGNYRQGLARGDRRLYYRGLARFIGRYAAQESPKYIVDRVKFAPSSIRDGRSIFVDSQIVLKNGGTYEVRWLLVPNRKTFKVRDAQVLSFWVSPFLQSLFQNYISENGGQVGSLVIALNR